jgi:phosphoserine phosphatase RsbU/P
MWVENSDRYMATSARVNLDPGVSAVARPLRDDQVQDLLKLQKATRKISSVLDLDQLIHQVVHEVAASFGFLETNIYLRDAENNTMVLAGVHGCKLHGQGEGLRIGKDGMVGYVAETGQMRYAPDVRKDNYYIECQTDTQSEVAIPLDVDGEVIGVFTASHPEVDGFSAEQLRLLQSLCSHVAIAVQNARKFESERKQREQMTREVHEARLIQQALLPKSSPYVPGFAITGTTCPAGAMGGDWYDFIPLEDNCWGLVLADVAGKGTAAALLMSATRGMLRSLAEAHCRPAEVLTRLNRLMVQDIPSGRFVTMVYGVLDPEERTLTFANAGHLHPLLITAAGPQFLDSEAGLPLGVSLGAYSEQTVALPEGSRFVLYSDGLTEAENRDEEEYGTARLANHFLRGDASPESIIDDVRSFAAVNSVRDDATVILIQSAASSGLCLTAWS